MKLVMHGAGLENAGDNGGVMILVTGANGLNGTELLKRLSAHGVPVRALVRNRAKASAISALPNVEIVEGDMKRPDSLVQPLRGVDKAVLISTSNEEMQEVQVSFIDAAKKAGVKHVVKLSGIIRDVHSPFRFARMHDEIERHLEASGMAYTHLRSGEFMQAYFRNVPTIMSKGALFLALEEARLASFDVGDLAEVMEIVLTRPGHEGKAYPLTGPESLTMAEVAQRIGAAIGKEVRYVNVSPEEARKARLAAGVPVERADALDELFAERRKGMESRVYPDAGVLLGRPPTTFSEFAKRNAAIFRGEQPAPNL